MVHWSGIILSSFGGVRLDCEIEGTFICGETILSWFLLRDLTNYDLVFKRAMDLCSCTSSKVLG